jgi:hypothetical protein
MTTSGMPGVARQLVDAALHAVCSKNLPELQDGEELDQGAGQQDHAGTTEHHGRDGDGVEIRGVDRPDFAVADAVDGEQHHVGGVAEAPARRHIGKRGEHHDRPDKEQDRDEIPDRGAKDAFGVGEESAHGSGV